MAKRTQTNKPKLKYLHAGQPPSFISPQDMLERADSYFKECKGKGRGWKERPSKAGLFFHSNVTRETYNTYAHKKEYSDTVKRIFNFIEQQWVGKLNEPYPTGGIFYLKNAFKEEYRDRYDHTTDGEKMPAPVIIMYGPQDRLAKVMEKRKK